MKYALLRVARFFVRKIHRLITEYDLTPVVPPAENMAERASRNIAAWLLTKVLYLVAHFPYLRPAVAETANQEMNRVIRDLFGDGLMGTT